MTRAYDIRLLVDPRIVAEAMEGNHGNRAWAERTIQECETALEQVHAQMGPADVDAEARMNRITCLSGSAGEKVQKLVKMHSELTAARDVLRNIELLGQEGATLGITPTVGNVLANDRSFMERVEAAGQGTSVKQDLAIVRHSPAMAAVDRTDYVPEVYKRGPIIQTAKLRQYSPLRSLNGTVIVPRGAEGGTIRHKRESGSSTPAPRAEAAKATNLTPSLVNVDAEIESISARVDGISDEATQDYPGLIRHLSDYATRLAVIELDEQVAGGNGTSPQLEGARSAANMTTQKHARVNANTNRAPADPIVEIRKAMTTIWAKGETADAVWMDPSIWEGIQTKQTATEGLFVYGPPIAAPAERIWGLNVALSTDVSDNITAWAANEDWAVVGPFMSGCDLFMKQQATFELGWSGSDFTSFQRTGRVTLRAAMVWYRPDAFVRIGSGAD